MERAAHPLRRCGRRRDERVRARGARARSAGQRLRPGRVPLHRAPGGRRRAAGADRRARRARTCQTETTWRSSTQAPSRPRTPSARRPARAACPSAPRAELLGELTALRRTIAVAGTHGKTTTSAMLVCALRAAGLDARLARRRRRSGTGSGQRAAGRARASGWSSRRTSPIARCSALDVDIAVLTNVELDHHATFGSLAELREAFGAVPGARGRAIVVWDRPELLRSLRSPGRGSSARSSTTRQNRRSWHGGSRFDWRGHEVTLSVPGVHNAAERGRRAGGRAAGRRRRGARGRAAWPDFSGAGRRFQLLGETAGGRAGVRRLRPPPDRGRGDARAAPHPGARAPGGGLPAAPVLAHADARTRVRRGARRRRRDGRARRISGARARGGLIRASTGCSSPRQPPTRARAGRCTGCRRSPTPSRCCASCWAREICAW